MLLVLITVVIPDGRVVVPPHRVRNTCFHRSAPRLTGSIASVDSDYLISALAPKPRLTKYQVDMVTFVEELKSSVDEMKVQFIEF